MPEVSKPSKSSILLAEVLSHPKVIKSISDLLNNMFAANNFSPFICRQMITEYLGEYYSSEEIDDIAERIYGFVEEEKRKSHSQGMLKGAAIVLFFQWLVNNLNRK